MTRNNTTSAEAEMAARLHEEWERINRELGEALCGEYQHHSEDDIMGAVKEVAEAYGMPDVIMEPLRGCGSTEHIKRSDDEED